MSPRQLPIILALGTTQTLSWASSYYLPAILADPIARDLGVSSNWIFAAFSASLVISALIGPRVGRQIDLVGGRSVLSASNLVLAAGLALLGLSYSVPVLVIAWLLLGIGMGAGLYDAAFGALGRIYGDAARRSITGITLIAGFASTVGWPLSALGLETIGWRNTCFAWALAHLLIGVPLNFFMLPAVKGAKAAVAAAVKPHIPIDRTMIVLAFVFAAAWSVTGAMAAHLPRILEAAGATTLQAVAAGALIGPAQVAARIFEASFLSRYHPLVSTRLACLTHPIGAAIVWLVGGAAASVFADLPRHRQRHPDDCARHPAAGDLRPAELWLSARHHRRAGADGAGRRTAGIRPAGGDHGQPRADRLLGAQPVGAAGAVPAAKAAGGELIRACCERICPLSIARRFEQNRGDGKRQPSTELQGIRPLGDHAAASLCGLSHRPVPGRGTVVLCRHVEAEKTRRPRAAAGIRAAKMNLRILP